MSSCNVNYDGQRGPLDCTVPAAERQKAIAEERKAIADQVASNQEYQRVPKGQRKLKHILKEEIYKDGVTEQVKSETVTTRQNH